MEVQETFAVLLVVPLDIASEEVAVNQIVLTADAVKRVRLSLVPKRHYIVTFIKSLGMLCLQIL